VKKGWIASRSLSSGAHSRDPLARNDANKNGGPFGPPQMMRVGLRDGIFALYVDAFS
jgi:hypothetical protein